jgi:hypothetical protein
VEAVYCTNSQKGVIKLKLDGTHQLLAYADDVNLLIDINKNKEALIYANKMIGL